MTRDDIIRLAEEAGVHEGGAENWVNGNRWEAFAALVAATEREKVAKWMIQRGYATGHGDTTEDLLAELDWQADERITKAAAAEREKVAQMIEDAPPLVDFAKNEHDGCLMCGFTPKLAASAIRARGSNG